MGSAISAVHAATITWDGGGVGGTALDTPANWVGDVLPTTSDEVLFDNSVITSGSYPTNLLNSTTAQTWGSIIWNNSQSGVAITMGGSAGGKTLALSGGGGSAAAIAAGGASGDIILLGSAFTSGTFSINGTDGTGSSRLTLTLPNTTGNYNIDVVNAGATLAFGATTNGVTAANTTISKTGAGTLTFNNGNISMFSGGATGRKFILDQGTLNVANNATLGAATLEIHAGTTLDNSGTSTNLLLTTNTQSWTGDFTFAGTGSGGLTVGNAAATSAITLSGSGSARTVTVSAASLTIGGVIGGSGYGLTKAGAGGLILGAANTYDGATTISGGTLSTSVANALPGTTEVIIANGTSTANTGTLNLNGFDQTVAKLSSSGAGGTKGVVMNNGANSTKTLTVTGTSTFDGTLKNGTSAPSTRILALEKSTGGTLRLTGIASTYTGGTIVSGGTLLANNASGSATGTGAITVNGGYFGGTGTVSGAITVNAGGAISPGDGGAGTFTGGSSLTWNSDNTLAGMTFDLGVNQAASDKLALTGAFTKGTGSTFVFNFVDAGYTPSFAYTVVTFGSTTFTAGDFSATGLAGSFAVVGNSLQFTVAAIPEPSSYAALVGVLALGCGLLARRRRA